MMLSRPLILLFVFTLSACSNMGEQRIEKKPSEANLSEAAKVNIELGVGYIQRKQFKAAKDKLEKAIEQDPDNAEAYRTLAYLYSMLGLSEQAEEKYEEALKLQPNDPEILNGYGAFLCAHGELEKAQEKFKLAYSNPFYDSLYLAQSNAGSCYLQEGKYVEAEALLRKSLRVQPRLAGSLISMAEIGVKTEKYLMARAYVQRYHEVKKPTAESLWILVQAEKALGAREHYMKYARQLIKDFPDSDEAGWLEAQARNESFR